jgi:hypothetical protein
MCSKCGTLASADQTTDRGCCPFCDYLKDKRPPQALRAGVIPSFASERVGRAFVIWPQVAAVNDRSLERDPGEGTTEQDA